MKIWCLSFINQFRFWNNNQSIQMSSTENLQLNFARDIHLNDKTSLIVWIKNENSEQHYFKKSLLMPFSKTKTTKMLFWFVKILFKWIMQKFYWSRIRWKIKSAFSSSKTLTESLQSRFVIAWTLQSQFIATSSTIRHRIRAKTDSSSSHKN